MTNIKKFLINNLQYNAIYYFRSILTVLFFPKYVVFFSIIIVASDGIGSYLHIAVEF